MIEVILILCGGLLMFFLGRLSVRDQPAPDLVRERDPADYEALRLYAQGEARAAIHARSVARQLYGLARLLQYDPARRVYEVDELTLARHNVRIPARPLHQP